MNKFLLNKDQPIFSEKKRKNEKNSVNPTPNLVETSLKQESISTYIPPQINERNTLEGDFLLRNLNNMHFYSLAAAAAHQNNEFNNQMMANFIKMFASHTFPLFNFQLERFFFNPNLANSKFLNCFKKLFY